MSDAEPAEKEAERLLPCNCSLHGSVAATSLHDLHCHARLRPAVAAALRERDERIAEISEGLVWLAHRVMEATGSAPSIAIYSRQYVVDHVTALRDERDRLRAALEGDR